MKDTVVAGLSLPFLAILSGCSFILTSGPPDNYEERRSFDCSSSLAPPLIDTATVLVSGLLIGLNAGNIDDPAYDQDGVKTRVGLGIVGALVFLPSAIYGYVKSGNCRDAQANMARRHLEEGGAEDRPRRARPTPVPGEPAVTTPSPATDDAPQPPPVPAAPAARSPASPHVKVTLKSGRVVEGALVQEVRGKYVVVQTDDGVEERIPDEDIRSYKKSK